MILEKWKPLLKQLCSDGWGNKGSFKVKKKREKIEREDEEGGEAETGKKE